MQRCCFVIGGFFVKGNIIIGEWGIFGVEIFLCYSQFFIKGDFVIGGVECILANWPNDKHIICNINNDILIKIPSHPYVLVNRSVLCNCGIVAENHFLLESLAGC